LIALLFTSFVSADCVQNGLIKASTAFGLCQTEAIIGSITDGTGGKVCNCIGNFSVAAGLNCDATTLAILDYCAGATIVAAALSNSNYDFGSSCNSCANPPASPNWPSTCSKCFESYTACLSTGSFDLKARTSVALSFSISQTCSCIGQFVSCFEGCNSPLSNYATNICNNFNTLCACNGTTTVKAAIGDIVKYLKSTWTNFNSFLLNLQGTPITSVDCQTKTTNLGSTLATGRFVCDFTFLTQVLTCPN